ncbi:MAG: hypothetical protein KDA51_14105, partial [Planctomycetales bacterium]|nr:hypothetical protein [Planctomycetales bacterium]
IACSVNRHRDVDESIDWPAVLGPVLSSSSTGNSTAVRADELAELQRTTFSHVRRAVRPRPSLTTDELPFPSEPVAWFPQGRFLIESPGSMVARPGAFVQYAAGDYYIQDAGSMLALALCGARPGEWVCDTCAAPGGKSTGLLEQLGGTGVLVANEVIRSRLSLLSVALERTGYGNQLLTNLEVEQLAHLCGPVFDSVLVDAPCTGQTMVARGKQSMAAFGAAQMAHSSARQQRILRAAAGLVKSGGRLVYSTCAYSYAENEAIVLEFANEQPGWQLTAQAGLEAWSSPLAEGCYRVWPHRHGCCGAFAALLVNHAGANVGASGLAPRRLRPRVAWKEFERLPVELDELLSAEQGVWRLHDDQLHRFESSLPIDWIRCAVAGTEIARRTVESRGERWTPSFGASQLHNSGGAAGRVELDDAEAIRYVAGESLRGVGGVSQEWRGEVLSGWCMVVWRGRRLGWGKLTQGVLKNHFPKILRQPSSVC